MVLKEIDVKSLAIAGIPLGALVLLQRIPQLKVRVYAIGGDKKKGISEFWIAARVKNTGDVDISGWHIEMYASGPGGVNFPLAVADISLAKGEEKRFPATDYYKKKVPENIPTGTYSAVVFVVDSPSNQPGNIVTQSRLDNAWNVIEPVRKVDITAIEVA